MYRYWHYVAYMRTLFEDGGFAFDGLLPGDNKLLAFAPFLDTFSTDELYEIGRVYSFLYDTSDWIARAAPDNMFTAADPCK